MQRGNDRKEDTPNQIEQEIGDAVAVEPAQLIQRERRQDGYRANDFDDQVRQSALVKIFSRDWTDAYKEIESPASL
jgi:hypothetical protein